MIPTYNPRPDYPEDTLHSVLQQDPGPEQMQIEVIDGRSTDDLAPKTGGLCYSAWNAPQCTGGPRQPVACLGVDDPNGYIDIGAPLKITVDFGEWKPQELLACERSLIVKELRC